jgi:preprotein translocase subunit SecD
MDRSWWWRLALVVGVTLGAIWFLVPSYYSFFVLPREQRNSVQALKERLPSWAPSASSRLNLGLDLQGGIHMVLRVDTQTALQKRTERRAQQIENWVADKKLGEVDAVASAESLQIAVTAKDPATMDAIEKELLEVFGDFNRVGREGGTLTLNLNDTRIAQFQEEAVDQAMLVIRRRIDKYGVAEVDVRKLGTDAIQVSMPGRQNADEARELLGRTGQLEFRLVDDASNWAQETAQSSPPPAGVQLTTSEGFPQFESADQQALLSYVEGKAPADRQVLLECVQSGATASRCASYRTYLVEKGVPLTGDSLTQADADRDPATGSPLVRIAFDQAGARDFEKLTGDNVGRRMAIVLEDTVNSAPRINERIGGGSAQITLGGGGRSYDVMAREAQLLATTLKAGALPAPVTVGEIRTVGASLGDELVRKGTLAALVGLALVLVFMAIYYKGAGLIADVALVLNGALILAGLAFFNATLTLPGIAGFVLTLGIAVDANVLINERIREELAAGKSARAAVDQGYDRVFWTIFDAHVTTLIAGFVLYFMGTGPIRGFATSLIVGLLASLFTSIVVTRLITTYLVHGRDAKTVSV